MSEWRETTLSEIVEIIPGYAFKGKHFGDAGSVVIKIKDINPPYVDLSSALKVDMSNYAAQNLEKYKLEKGQAVLAMTGATIGKIGRLKETEDVFVNQRVAKFAAKEGYNYDYAIYSISGDDFQSFIQNNIDSNSAQENISATSIGRYPISLPPLPEQKAIAEVLSSLDDKIDLLHRQNKTLEQMAETLFRQWFMEEAGEDWEEVLLSDLIEIKGGFSYKGKYIGEGSSLLLGMGCVSFNNRFLHTGARLYSGECPISHLVEPGDLVIATRQQSDNMPILGFPAIIPKSYEGKKVIVGTNLYRLINNSEFDNYFFYKLFRSAEYRSHILSCAKGSTVRMITKDAIESYVIRKPPTEIYNNYQSKSVKINNRINNILEQIRTLESLRDTLLPKLMSGEVRIASHG